MRADGVFDDAPHDKTRLFGNALRRIVGIFRVEPWDAGNQTQTLEREFSRDFGDDDASVDGLRGAIDDEEIVVENAGADHRVAAGSHEKGCGFVFDEECGEVDTPVEMIVGRRRKACGNAR